MEGYRMKLNKNEKEQTRIYWSITSINQNLQVMNARSIFM